MRRLRSKPWLRDLVQEHRLHVKDLIYPLFIQEGSNTDTPIKSLPGVSRLTPDLAARVAKQAQDLGIPALLLFGIVPDAQKDEIGSPAFDPNNIVCQGIKAIKAAAPDIGIIADLCFCEYTDHGHCGPLTACGDVDNVATIKNLGKQAVNLAKAGADIIAPSDMMDGRVAAIRAALDEAGFIHVPVMSYAAKFASSFYGPFREAAGCALGAYPHALKDRKTYQMNSTNTQEAMREVEADIAEGADMLIVKPGLPYLDIVYQVKQNYGLPTFAYHVSGEYAMLKAAAANGWIDEELTMMETMLSFKRAGCDGIITYAAMDLAKKL
jgi:porphobilinogen synthase